MVSPMIVATIASADDDQTLIEPFSADSPARMRMIAPGTSSPRNMLFSSSTPKNTT